MGLNIEVILLSLARTGGPTTWRRRRGRITTWTWTWSSSRSGPGHSALSVTVNCPHPGLRLQLLGGCPERDEQLQHAGPQQGAGLRLQHAGQERGPRQRGGAGEVRPHLYLCYCPHVNTAQGHRSGAQGGPQSLDRDRLRGGAEQIQVRARRSLSVEKRCHTSHV